MALLCLIRCNRSSLKLLRLYSSMQGSDLDLNYYCDSRNLAEIEENIHMRKGIGKIKDVLKMHKLLEVAQPNDEAVNSIREAFYKELYNLPNKTHPASKAYKDNPKLVKELNEKISFGEHRPLEFSEIARRLNLMRTDQLGHTCGHKSYYFTGELAELEEALIKYTVTNLLKRNFRLVSVPDILPSAILESCGMTVNSDRTQIYSLDPALHGPDQYLSGTAEMALAGLLKDTVHPLEDLPLKLMAVSRCYRAETSHVIDQRGIYRVHQFTKVEMFAVTTPEQSDEMLEYLRETEEALFSPLGFHMQILDMPAKELGAPAYRKYDIEAWMPGRQSFGEISSCSNCTDFQSRRLGIKYLDARGSKEFAHTLNGTACAVPRMLIALIENHQKPSGKVEIPEILRPFIAGKEFISKNKSVPELKLSKIKNR